MQHQLIQGPGSGGEDSQMEDVTANFEQSGILKKVSTINQEVSQVSTFQQKIELSKENDTQMLRLIQQYLTDHGFKDVAADLAQKSKVCMEEEAVNEFRACVLRGEFGQARDLLQSRALTIGSERLMVIEYLIYEQEYLELLEQGRRLEAVQMLQRELMQRADKANISKLHALAQLIMCQTEPQIPGEISELRKTARWKGSESDGRKDLMDRIQQLMPAHEMLPPRRLETLVKQSLAYQEYNCKYHNMGFENQAYSFLEDHTCSKHNAIPSKCIAILQKHKDEVWQVKFSASGARFASIGKDNLLYLWLLTKQVSKKSSTQSRYQVKCTHEIRCHAKQVNALNWSTGLEDRFVITASQDQTARIWNAKTGKIVVEISSQKEAITAAAFVSGNDYQVVTGSVDKLVILWEIRLQNGLSMASELSSGPLSYEVAQIARVETRNYLDIAISSSRLVTMGQNYIQVFSIPQYSINQGNAIQNALTNPNSNYEIEMTDSVTSIALSKDGRFLLANVSLKSPRLELYDLGGPTSRKAEIVRKFNGGHEQTIFVLRCAFGGAHQGFVLCGSEDATVSIWSKEKGEIVTKLQGGHTQVINSVNWCPADPLLLITASDDQTLRLWGSESMAACEVITDHKDLKRNDYIKTVNAAAGAGASLSQEDIEEDDEEEEDDEDDDEEFESEEDVDYQERIEEEEDEDEEAMEDEDQYRPILRASRVVRRGRRAQQREEEDDEWAEEEGDGSNL